MGNSIELFTDDHETQEWSAYYHDGAVNGETRWLKGPDGVYSNRVQTILEPDDPFISYSRAEMDGLGHDFGTRVRRRLGLGHQIF